ncbi:DNA polymerase III subunit gamma/tau [Planctomyces sp. SH-PL14]|uniref:DNA polymerase III subunit gamma/tau n=1 Tax=Planctomyces sp. SH-PL14 TaxID=1632864 RepID=UPI00078CDA27|nr:DNA polymerase III subunit gamma/tau [Planctomyces sp. SH-PL14]AMV16687.1 DNA polymerase III subunit tau [Planctomyces sp. SH-PL14]
MTDRQPQYTVLARRFRPQTFDEVVGQGHVGQSLRNAIRQQRVAHAYLFTGARGVGKTSTARIFAKALNCPNAVDGVPCNQCEVCTSIAAGSDVDVLEIDGASNRGIDDIRQLRANVNVRSMRSPYKVYIIDEVHMLTKEAFNALLKTLEEPPPNVKFIFCTTEPNKVPDTILSRCQRFDFGTIATDRIMGRLREIAEAEGRVVDEEALELVARRAAGSMRDSQSLFDQLLAFGSERVQAEDVHRLLGTAPDERIIDLIDAVIRSDRPGVLSRLHNAAEVGVELGVFSDQLLNYLRDLIVVSVGADEVPLLAVSERVRDALREQAGRWAVSTASAAMQILAEAKNRMQRVNYARSLLELALIRMTLLAELTPLSQVGGPAPASRPATPPSPGTAPRPAMPPRMPPASPAAPRPDEKKNGAEHPPAVTAPAVPPPPATPVAPPPSASRSAPEPEPEGADCAPGAQIALSAGTMATFAGELLTRLPEVMASHLKNATFAAITGPNSLDLRFPKSYGFSRMYCAKAENLKRLQQYIDELAGTPVQIRISEDASVTAPAAPVAAKPAMAERRRPTSVEGDVFVQQAVAILNATVVDVREYSGATAIEGSDSGDANADPEE